MAESAGFDDGTADSLAGAVDAATTNCIERAYRGASDRGVELSFADTGTELCVDVADRGRRSPVRRSKKGVREAGQGATEGMVEAILDSAILRRDGGRNVRRLVKRKPARSRAG